MNKYQWFRAQSGSGVVSRMRFRASSGSGAVIYQIVFSPIRLAYKGFLLLSKETVSCPGTGRTGVLGDAIFKSVRRSAAV